MGTKLLTADEFIAMAREHTYPAEKCSTTKQYTVGSGGTQHSQIMFYSATFENSVPGDRCTRTE